MAAKSMARLGRIVGRAVAVFGLVAGSGLVAQMEAQAKLPGLTYFTAGTGEDSTFYKSIRVFCPAGTQLVGGSFVLEGAEGAVVLDDFIPSETNLLVGAGEIVEPGSGEGGTSNSWRIIATVACASALANYTVVSNTSLVGPFFSQSTFVRCPSETRLVGGGASLANGWGHVSIDGLHYAAGAGRDNSVTAHAETDVSAGGYKGSWSVTAYAICASVRSTVVVNADRSPSTTISQADTGICPSDGSDWSTTTVGWGINPANDYLTDRHITRATIAISGQTYGDARARATRGGTPWTFQAKVVCATL